MTSLAGMMMGAQQRLLPFWIPYRFFLAATVFHLVAWVMLGLAAGDVAGYRGGPGPLLGMLHAVTLGVLAMAAVGASLQILPVVTGQAMAAPWPAEVVAWLYMPGLVALLYGFHGGDVPAMAVGGAMVAGGLAIFAVLVGDVLRRTRDIFVIVRAYAWGGLAALVGLSVLGLLAIADYRMGFLGDHATVGLAHLVLALFGFMGLLAFGFSHILVPMFALSSPPGEAISKVGFGLAVAAVLGAVVGSLSGHGAVLALAAAAGLGAAGLHIRIMVKVLAGGMRKRLGLSFVLIKAAWALLVVALATGICAALGLGGDRVVAMFVFLALFGWLLTFLLGVLQRIMPFLSAMNASQGGMPRLSEMGAEGPLKVHAVCHFTALAAVAAGIATGSAAPIAGGALVGAAGAVAYAWFAVDVVRRLIVTTRKQKEKKRDV